MTWYLTNLAIVRKTRRIAQIHDSEHSHLCEMSAKPRCRQHVHFYQSDSHSMYQLCCYYHQLSVNNQNYPTKNAEKKKVDTTKPFIVKTCGTETESFISQSTYLHIDYTDIFYKDIFKCKFLFFLMTTVIKKINCRTYPQREWLSKRK